MCSFQSPRGQRDSAKSEDKRQELEEKQKRALERRRQHLENTARKAQDEEKKVRKHVGSLDMALGFLVAAIDMCCV